MMAFCRGIPKSSIFSLQFSIFNLQSSVFSQCMNRSLAQAESDRHRLTPTVLMQLSVLGLYRFSLRSLRAGCPRSTYGLSSRDPNRSYKISTFMPQSSIFNLQSSVFSFQLSTLSYPFSSFSFQLSVFAFSHLTFYLREPCYFRSIL